MNYVWLVEEFGPEGSSTGRYMRDRGSLAITYDVYAARRLRREMSAAFRALDMEEKHGGDWRPVEHGFLLSPVPAPQAEPSRAQKMREAGFTPRDTRLTCDECGAKFTRQFAPIHKCAEPTAQKDQK